MLEPIAYGVLARVAKRLLFKSSDLKALAQAIGVTRVARVTGLDRTGVEVACAVRPRGHILQVSNGKGRDWQTAQASALFEAAELWAAENPLHFSNGWASAEELRGQVDVWSPWDLGSEAGPLWTPSLRVAWLPAERLDAAGEVWVPAPAVYCPGDEGEQPGPSVMQWTSNGFAAGFERERAIAHALAEVMEREALCQLLPHGWTAQAMRRLERRVDAREWEARGFEVCVLEVTPRGWAWPVAAALLREKESRTLGVTAGYACRARWDEAVEAALLEAAQSRLTDIHGAREDVVSAEKGVELVLKKRALLPKRVELGSASLEAAIAALDSPVAVADLPSPLEGVHVVKAWVKGFRVSELLS